MAGPYPPQATVTGTTAIANTDASILAWATGYIGYEPNGTGSGCDRGTNLTSQFETPERALGQAGNSNGENIGTTFDIVSLGRGGCITLTFDTPIADGNGFDFAIFENGFYSSTPETAFLELAWVEVSSDGTNFFRFPAFTTHTFAVSAFANVMDASNFDGFAGKYIAGYGVPFDLSTLADDPLLDKNAVSHIRLIDIIGDGNTSDNSATPQAIYDPYPTSDSAGFDLDAVAVLNQASSTPVDEVQVPIPVWSQILIALQLVSQAINSRKKFIH